MSFGVWLIACMFWKNFPCSLSSTKLHTIIVFSGLIYFLSWVVQFPNYILGSWWSPRLWSNATFKKMKSKNLHGNDWSYMHISCRHLLSRNSMSLKIQCLTHRPCSSEALQHCAPSITLWESTTPFTHEQSLLVVFPNVIPSFCLASNWDVFPDYLWT